MRFSIDHPSDPVWRADYGFDPFVGFFAEVFIGADPDTAAILIYDRLQRGYDHQFPLQGALDFLVEHGFIGREDLADALRWAADEGARTPPRRLRPAVQVINGFKLAAD
jgi:hypothetical protein